MESIERVMNMSEKEALSPIFKKLHELKKAGHLEQEMFENIEVMLVGYFHYKQGVDIMGKRLGIREGAIGQHFPERRI